MVREREVCWLPGQRGILIITIRLKGASVAGATHTQCYQRQRGMVPTGTEKKGWVHIYIYTNIYEERRIKI